MGALFEAAMRQQQKQPGPANVTPQEQQKFLSAMKDPEFRSLLNEYMQEISDPRNRAETEQYLSQLENEQKVPADKQLVKPRPGFVVKTRWEAQKVFINVCSSDKLQPPSSTRVTSGQQGTSWNLPYSLGPERLEPDKGGSGVPTFDVCFHPRVIEFALARADYKNMVVNTCLDAVEAVMRDSRRKPTTQLSRSYHVLKGVMYKSGEPVTMCLRKEVEAPEPPKSKKQEAKTKKSDVKVETKEKGTVTGGKEAPTDVRGSGGSDNSVLSQLTHVEETGKTAPLIKEVSSTVISKQQGDTSKPQKRKMEHQLIYRGRFELLHHMQADPSKEVPEDRYRPKELVVEVSFPLSSSAKGLDLDVSEKVLRLSAGPSVPGNYEPLELALPYPVIEDKGSAKFDKKNHKLVVTLPVQPPPKPKPQSVSLIVEEDESDEEGVEDVQPAIVEQPVAKPPSPTIEVKKDGEDEFRMLRETALMVANDPQVLAHKQRLTRAPSPAKPVVTEPAAISDSIYDDLPPLESCSDEEDQDQLEDEAASASPTASPEASQATQPRYQLQDTPTCLSYIVSVADIDADSVQLTFPSATSLRLQFVDTAQQSYELDIEQLPDRIDASTAECDVASENMVVILHKQALPEPVKLEPAPPLAAARFQNQLLYELD